TDIDVYYNRVTIDAKSILGVLSLDLTQVLTVEFNGEDAEFEAFLAAKAPGKCSAA
ncbi:MAG TPA: PTS cellobiose transporter subunit IIBC, partial [Clostridium sp.]|nr:PTS cellobiose transporter subunit IIBC [Clostridium sp.]